MTPGRVPSLGHLILVRGLHSTEFRAELMKGKEGGRGRSILWIEGLIGLCPFGNLF